MKKTVKIIIIILLLLPIVFLASGYYLGIFFTPEVKEQSMGPYIYLYEEYTGDYKNTGLVFERVNRY
jgi:hypothetical protein